MLVNGIGRRWDNASGDWITRMLTDYYYSEFKSSSIPETGTANILVFPNPAIDQICIDLSTSPEPAIFELHDMQGRMVLSETLTGTRNRIPVTGLPGGLYLYRIIQKGETHFGKIVKK
jgi:hypothetical protein